MAYKRKSPLPIAEGGTNNQTMANTNGTVIYDGTSLSTINPGTSGYVLTSMGAGIAPAFNPAAGSGGAFWIGSAGGNLSQITAWDGTAPNWATWINEIGAVQTTNGILTQFVFPFAATLSNLYVIVYSNNSSNTTTSTITINNVSSALTVTIPSTTTGTFSDTTHSVMVTAGSTLLLVSNQTGGMGQAVIGQFTLRVTT
jgi:hypothetical protein